MNDKKIYFVYHIFLQTNYKFSLKYFSIIIYAISIIKIIKLDIPTYINYTYKYVHMYQNLPLLETASSIKDAAV